MTRGRPYPASGEDYDPGEDRLWQDERLRRSLDDEGVTDPVEPEEPTEVEREQMLTEYRERMGRAT